MSRDVLSGADLLRRIVRVMNECRESFLDRYDAPTLLKIFTAHQESNVDEYPDAWNEATLAAVLAPHGAHGNKERT